jgi:O-acetyl-ADP-ribose deacetylase (regulator of RNase III)
MGAGIAKFIASRFPEAVAADRATPRRDRSKLGTLSVAPVTPGSVTFQIVSAYTQFDHKRRGRKADYDPTGQAFREIASRFGGLRIWHPLIGAGLGGGDWAMITPIIDEALEGLDHTLVVLD